MVVSVEGEDMDRDDFTNDAGWCEVRRRNTKKTSEGTAGPTRPMQETPQRRRARLGTASGKVDEPFVKLSRQVGYLVYQQKTTK
ncbi:hypothetical protein HPB50_026689 [Hyalomma asiaticum]|uniref:Uncharacterized protein n=1 Tax=Hyalomma asiaticum TaxID=266040 RepID=A0ACB7TRJ1_HYAAI|nr:hypothetical protein HPB50_026689 [Hyalomma asiaticum]